MPCTSSNGGAFGSPHSSTCKRVVSSSTCRLRGTSPKLATYAWSAPKSEVITGSCGPTIGARPELSRGATSGEVRCGRVIARAAARYYECRADRGWFRRLRACCGHTACLVPRGTNGDVSVCATPPSWTRADHGSEEGVFMRLANISVSGALLLAFAACTD